MSSAPASCIYEGAVRHRRFEQRRHEFRYRLALVYVDLDELPGLLGGALLARRPGLLRFRRRDYLGEAQAPPARSRTPCVTRCSARAAGAPAGRCGC